MLSDKENKLQNLINKYDRVVVGFSGGIDSTVVLDESVKTLGRENVCLLYTSDAADDTR